MYSITLPAFTLAATPSSFILHEREDRACRGCLQRARLFLWPDGSLTPAANTVRQFRSAHALSQFPQNHFRARFFIKKVFQRRILGYTLAHASLRRPSDIVFPALCPRVR